MQYRLKPTPWHLSIGLMSVMLALGLALAAVLHPAVEKTGLALLAAGGVQLVLTGILKRSEKAGAVALLAYGLALTMTPLMQAFGIANIAIGAWAAARALKREGGKASK